MTWPHALKINIVRLVLHTKTGRTLAGTNLDFNPD